MNLHLPGRCFCCWAKSPTPLNRIFKKGRNIYKSFQFLDAFQFTPFCPSDPILYWWRVRSLLQFRVLSGQWQRCEKSLQHDHELSGQRAGCHALTQSTTNLSNPSKVLQKQLYSSRLYYRGIMLRVRTQPLPSVYSCPVDKPPQTETCSSTLSSPSRKLFFFQYFNKHITSYFT